MKPSQEPLERAKALFSWLWMRKPARYKPKGNYRLDEVIDAQQSDDAKTIGNCLGLTLLYNCLLRGMDITAGALYLEYAFGTGHQLWRNCVFKSGGGYLVIKYV
jgi:hypothetical protein